MRKSVVVSAALLLVIGLAAVSHAGLEDFMAGLNVQARADLDGFSVRVSSQFGIPVPDVRAVMEAVESPADAFMCFQLGQLAGTKPETVVETYTRHKGEGWGVIAKELGIKPGSAEFHRLKSGDFALAGSQSSGSAQAKGKGKGKKK